MMNQRFDLKSKRGTVLICYCLLILLTVLFIFKNSTTPTEISAGQSEAVSGFLKNFLDPFNTMSPEQFEHFVRKLAHFVEFGLLGFELALLAFHISGGFKPNGAVYSAFAALLCANLDELLQFYSNRGSLVSDVFIDLGGALCGIAAGYTAAYTVRAIYRRVKAKRLS